MASRTAEQEPDRKRLPKLSLNACLVARDAAANLLELIDRSSSLAFMAVRDCERELDQLERQFDEQMPAAISRVSEDTARELLASLKLVTDLERIGDLLLGAAQRLRALKTELPAKDKSDLHEIASTLTHMLQQIHTGLLQRSPEVATAVLRSDRQINDIYRALFQRHFRTQNRQSWRVSTNVLFIAAALERAGDHTQNLAEELLHLVSGHTVRHQPKKTTYS